MMLGECISNKDAHSLHLTHCMQAAPIMALLRGIGRMLASIRLLIPYFRTGAQAAAAASKTTAAAAAPVAKSSGRITRAFKMVLVIVRECQLIALVSVRCSDGPLRLKTASTR